MKTYDIEKLTARKLMGETLTSEEEAALQSWLQASAAHREAYEQLCKQHFSTERYKRYRQIHVGKAYEDFLEATEQRRHRTLTQVVLRQVAMWALPLLLAAGAFYYVNEQAQPDRVENVAIVPGGTEAVLQLADGETVDLNGDVPAKSGAAAKAVANATVTARGLVFHARPVAADTVQKVTDPYSLRTADNGEYHITLEDGTQVHLNYNTCLRFPERFASNERVVYLTGEAFFKVAEEKDRPFKVVTDHMVIKEYGTSFNVNTYSPKQTEVVLVEGSIGVLAGGQEYPVKPHEKITLDTSTTEIRIDSVDVTSYVAWHEGRFIFENESLGDIMETLSHWYDVEVSFDRPELQDLHFTGNLDRYGSLSSILKSISQTVGLRIVVKQRNVFIYQ